MPVTVEFDSLAPFVLSSKFKSIFFLFSCEAVFFNSFDAQHEQQKGIFCKLPEFKPQYCQTGLKFTIDSVTLTGNFTKMFCPSIHPCFLEATEKGGNKNMQRLCIIAATRVEKRCCTFPTRFFTCLASAFL